MKKGVKYTFIAAILISVAGIAVAVHMYTLSHKNLEKVKPDFTMTAAELTEEFIKNEASASSEYTGKVLEITGTIKEIYSGVNNSSNVVLASGSDFSSVICTFPDIRTVAGLEEGHEIKVRGECAGFLLDILMNNCIIVSE